MLKLRVAISVLLFLAALASTIYLTQRPTKGELLQQIRASAIHEKDLALIEAHSDELAAPQLRDIHAFLTDSNVFADSSYFEVSAYRNWDEYTFQRPASEVALSILARRDLFLDPARQVNNRAITNMSDEALATLVFSQTYLEEKWDNTVPWDGDPNTTFNWIQPELLVEPSWDDYVAGDFLFRERVRYWFATRKPELLEQYGEGNDIDAALYHIHAPIPNVPRLAGYSYPIGNQLYLQTAETLLWYGDYLEVAEQRYGFLRLAKLDTAIPIPKNSETDLQQSPPQDWQFQEYSGLWGLLHAPFAVDLRLELSHPEKAAFWNVMRFVHAGARQREGGGSEQRPGDNQPPIMALRYAERSPSPVGRAPEDISAFSLITTVYSDSILLDFTNWNAANDTLIVQPIDNSRSDGIHRRLSERNKAIRVVEHLGDESFYPNAMHIGGSRGLGFALVSQYDNPRGDFLAYIPEEAFFLIRALSMEASDFGIDESADTLCNAPLLQAAYENYEDSVAGTRSFAELAELICHE